LGFATVKTRLRVVVGAAVFAVLALVEAKEDVALVITGGGRGRGGFLGHGVF
jgi:hypothetical protein